MHLLAFSHFCSICNMQVMSDISRANVAKALLQSLSSAGVKWIRFVITDASNQIRSKAINITARQVEDNPEMILDGAMVVTCINGLFTHVDGIAYGTSVGSELMMPNLGTLHVLPYHPSHAAMYCTNFAAPDKISDLCPRAFLEKQINSARAARIHFAVGVEIEFILMKDGDPTSIRNFMDDIKFNASAEFIDQVVDMLKAQRNACLPIEIIHSECDSGQNEIVVRYSWNPMETADSIITIRRTIHAVAEQHGYRATFLPKPIPDTTGSGMHLHLSFSDADDGESKLGGDKEYGLSDTGSNMIMGVVKHLPALMAITQPTQNSYERMKPGSWSGHKQSWAIEDKESAVRVCKDFSTQSHDNIEFKVCDATANPYLAIGSLLAAALDGINNKLQLCPPGEGDELPNNLTDCLVNLRQSQFFKDAMGTALFDCFVAIKDSDSKLADKDVDVY